LYYILPLSLAFLFSHLIGCQTAAAFAQSAVVVADPAVVTSELAAAAEV
jgi:hypothetical protein